MAEYEQEQEEETRKELEAWAAFNDYVGVTEKCPLQ